ncbi:2-oxoacid:acceptor oxidoreductase subunit alpha [Candidatus Bathyarchaeota archaeon]|nr:2-oxoacid:acceptor oxidoreductase subunit alpha [Candidatus Bathyarchaeota archaeon]
MIGISIVLAGQAGQGIQTVERLLTRILKLDGFHVFATKEYMSRVRGGANSTEIRVSSEPVRAYVDAIDILIPIDKEAMKRLEPRIGTGTLIVGDTSYLGDVNNLLEVPITELAKDLGNKIYSNIIAVGICCGMLDVDMNLAKDYVRTFFKEKDDDIISKNVEAIEVGFKRGKDARDTNLISLDISKDDSIKDDLLLHGGEAISLGAVAGGCNFISSYPMSPSTAVLVSLAQKTEELDIISEQAEDEISAINMALGAWYAGARAMITTSGGGFALMTEGLSLAGMIESPVVMHLAQRPGPATGLPTRTEQGDLALALHGGHGEFPRIIIAPATIEECFYLTNESFNLADEYQVPVIILTDQYTIDSYYNISSLDPTKVENTRHFIKTGEEYHRYTITESGISPRGIPGYGKGLVCVDSDEHDQQGHITENFTVRKQQMDKRLRKLDGFFKNMQEPAYHGSESPGTLVVGWGSTYHAIREAINRVGDESIAHVHYSILHPLHPSTGDILNKAKKVVIVESNATSQFGRYIRAETGIKTDATILKYTGEPFSVEDIVKRLKEEI